MKSLFFWVLAPSFNIIFSSTIHLCTKFTISSSLWSNRIPCAPPHIHIVIYNHIVIIHSLMGGLLDCFHFLAINRIAQTFLSKYPWSKMSSPLDISQEGLAESYGTVIFKFLRILHTEFQCDCTASQSHEQWMRVPFSAHTQQQIMVSSFVHLKHSDYDIF